MRGRCGRWLLCSTGIAAAIVGLGCKSGGRTLLLVDLKTDLLPFVEVVAVRTERLSELPGEPGTLVQARVERMFERGEDLIAGVRAAELEDVPRGDQVVRMQLLDGNGLVVVERIAVVTVRGPTVATLVLTRDCRDVSCPGVEDPMTAIACLGGRCVDPRCLPEAPGACPADPECVTTTDCPASVAGCASSTCDSTVCLERADDTMCAPGGYCDPDLGCVGGGGMDAGLDAGLDAGMEAGPPDGAAAEAGPVDANVDGSVDAPADSSCGVDQVRGTDGGCLWNDPRLVDLALSAGPIVPAFSSELTSYSLQVPLDVGRTTVTATAAVPEGVAITINGIAAASDVPSPSLVLDWSTLITIEVVADSGATRTYQVSVTRSGQDYVKPPSPAMTDRLGYSVDVSGDGHVLAGLAISGQTLHVFRRSVDGWTHEAAIPTPSYSAEGDRLAISRDGTTIIAGTFTALQVFRQVAGAWQLVDTLQPPAPHDTASLNDGLALSGDGTVIVAADALASAAEGYGVVFSFRFDGSQWQPGEVIEPPPGTAAEAFGVAVALSDDGTVLIAGAPNTALGPEGVICGTIHVLRWDGASWQPEGAVWNPDDDECDGLGDDLAVSADGTVFVAASKFESSDGSAPTNNRIPQSGAAFVYRLEGGTWVQDGYLKASNPGEGDNFGRRVAISGDGLHIGVGAWAEDSDLSSLSNDALPNAGAAYLFEWDGAQWTADGAFKAPNAGAGDLFGSAVALDLDGSTFVVGAQHEDGGGSDPSDDGTADSGAVYVFE